MKINIDKDRNGVITCKVSYYKDITEKTKLNTLLHNCDDKVKKDVKNILLEILTHRLSNVRL